MSFRNQSSCAGGSAGTVKNGEGCLYLQEGTCSPMDCMLRRWIRLALMLASGRQATLMIDLRKVIHGGLPALRWPLLDAGCEYHQAADRLRRCPVCALARRLIWYGNNPAMYQHVFRRGTGDVVLVFDAAF